MTSMARCPSAVLDHDIGANVVSLVEYSKSQHVVAAHILARRLGRAPECVRELGAESGQKLAAVELTKSASHPFGGSQRRGVMLSSWVPGRTQD